MSTRIEFAAAVNPQDPDDEFINFKIDDPAQALGYVAPPPLDTSPHQSAIDDFENARPGPIVSGVGDALWNCLKTHGSAKAAFLNLVNGLGADRQVTLTFFGNTDEAKRLPWEALRHGNKFLAHDHRIPILREIATSADEFPLRLTRGEELRLLVVLGARGDDGSLEWEAIKRAVNRVVNSLPVVVRVVAAHTGVNLSNANFSVTEGPVPENAVDLIYEIQGFAPHITHFYCHGYQKGGLDIETTGSARFGRQGSIKMTRTDLVQALDLISCITVLNACHQGGTGQATGTDDGSRSVCEELVESGFPIVVGMRRAIASTDASAFAEAFHTNALKEIDRVLQMGQGTVRLGAAFGDACRAISTKAAHNPAEAAAWTLPVLYVRPDDLQASRNDPDPSVPDPTGTLSPQDRAVALMEAKAELETLEAALVEHPEAFQAVADQIEARVRELHRLLGL